MNRTTVGVFGLCLLAIPARGQWQPELRATCDPAASKTAENSNTRTIAAAGDILHVVWTDRRDGNDEIYYKRSTDRGETWETDRRLTEADYRSWCPSVAAADTMVHVVWEDNRSRDWFDTYYKRSTDRGVTWSGDERLSTTGLAFEPSVAAAGDTVHVVWDGLPSVMPGEPLEVYYLRSTDGGATWDSVTRLTNAPVNYAWQPAVAAAGGNVHVAWYDGRHGAASPAEVYYKRSTDGGATWGIDSRLTNDSAASQSVSIAASGGRVHVAWSDERDGGANEIFYKRSTDGGATWQEDVRLTAPDGETSYFPSIAAAGDRVHVVWCDDRHATMGDDIYYKCSTDGGQTWGGDTRLSAVDDDQSRHPSIAVGDPALQVVWHDNRDGNYEVYYKCNPSGNVGASEAGVDFVAGAVCITPNPLSGSAVLNVRAVDGAGVRVYDALGRRVLARTFVARSEPASFPLDCRTLADGVYVVRVEAGGRPESRKLVVRR